MGMALLFFSVVAFCGLLMALYGWAINEEQHR